MSAITVMLGLARSRAVQQILAAMQLHAFLLQDIRDSTPRNKVTCPCY